MRLTLIALPAALLLAVAPAGAQPAPPGTVAPGTPSPWAAPPGTAPGQPPDASMSPAPHGRGVTREEFLQRVTAAAARRFDEMDTNHDGVLEPSERRAWAAAHRRGGAPASMPGEDGDPGAITVHNGSPPPR
jgi:hypothetical protein